MGQRLGYPIGVEGFALVHDDSESMIISPVRTAPDSNLLYRRLS